MPCHPCLSTVFNFLSTWAAPCWSLSPVPFTWVP
jgi:hypothetical protein